MKTLKSNNLYIDVQHLAFLLQSIMNNSRQALESDLQAEASEDGSDYQYDGVPDVSDSVDLDSEYETYPAEEQAATNNHDVDNSASMLKNGLVLFFKGLFGYLPKLLSGFITWLQGILSGFGLDFDTSIPNTASNASVSSATLNSSAERASVTSEHYSQPASNVSLDND